MSLNSPARIRANPLRGKERTNHGGTEDTERKFSRNLHTNGLLRVLRITKVYYLVFLTRFFEGASRPGSVGFLRHGLKRPPGRVENARLLMRPDRIDRSWLP